MSLHHPVGTAKMGAVDDDTAVVDTRLRVRGIRNLRVVDSSIQPVIIVTNSGACAMMIGEKGASMILEDWKKYEREQEEQLFGLKKLGKIENDFEFDNNKLRKRRKY